MLQIYQIKRNARIRLNYVVICIITFLSCSNPEPGKQVLIKEKFGEIDGYWLYLPATYDSESKWPLLIYLTGGDASSSPNFNTVKSTGPVKYALQQNGDPVLQKIVGNNFIIVNPHMTPGPKERRQWFQHAESVSRMIQRIQIKVSIDMEKIYVTGHSRGGHGSWGLAKRLSDIFAAVMPVSGELGCRIECDQIGSMPKWIIHGKEDRIVKYENSNHVVEFFRAKGQNVKELNHTHPREEDYEGQPFIFSTLEGKGHNIADEVYSSPQVYKWLLLQAKNINLENLNAPD